MEANIDSIKFEVIRNASVEEALRPQTGGDN